MSLLVAHHTWPLALGLFVAGALFIAAAPRLHFRHLAGWDAACPPPDAAEVTASEPAPNRTDPGLAATTHPSNFQHATN
jgi:hypothetical protein